MIKINYKKENGITLITLVFAIIIMVVISGTLLYNAGTGITTRNLNKMYQDIETLKDRVEMYYSQNKKLPVLEESYTSTNEIPSEISNSNPNDAGKYYVINLSALDNLTLNYGRGYEKYKENAYIYETDIYIINEQSHNIYYARGINFDGKKYYTIPGDYTKIAPIENKCNYPRLSEGMTPIKWKETEFVETEEYDPEWYKYIDTSVEGQAKNSKWANAKTKDGSMWVWIPRFAYKITYTIPTDKSKGGTIDIVFLKDNTNNDFNGNDVTKSDYIDENGKAGAYIVHPAFQDGTKNEYANGEWDKEIPGFWMAKFEAGYVGDANKLETANDSTVEYSTIYGYNSSTTAEWNQNYYGQRQEGDLIKYPTFQANRPSMNNISVSDAYDLCMSIKNATNVYGIKDADSHLTKNSEWGAVAYLAHSKYGRNGEEITINNVSAQGTNTIWAVTGYGGESVSSAVKGANLSDLIAGVENGNWTTDQGKLASTTGNIYGIYDISGGLWEYTAGYIATTGNYETYSRNLKGESNKYRSKYAHNGDGAINTSNYNESTNTNRLGEAIWETSTSGANSSAWNASRSIFVKTEEPFLVRGGCYMNGNYAGCFTFDQYQGWCDFSIGFRAVLVVE